MVVSCAMAREIVINFGGEVSNFPIDRVSREKLYGRKRRIVVDEHGEPCSAAQLTIDGATLLPSGGTSLVYVDEDFQMLERKELLAVSATGEDLESIPSSLGQERELTGPVPVEHFLDHTIVAVYALGADTIGETLAAALEEGAIFETRFNYTKGFSTSPLFVLKSEHGVWGLVGEPTGFEYLRRDVVLESDTDEDPFEDDLDFEMF
jgi:hypothetical protein